MSDYKVLLLALILTATAPIFIPWMIGTSLYNMIFKYEGPADSRYNK